MAEAAVAVPDDDIARIMYYLRSVTLSCGIDVIMDDLVDFRRHSELTDRRADQVFEVAYEFSPNELHGKTIFLDSSGKATESADHKFLDLDEAAAFVKADSAVNIGGRDLTIKRVMMFKQAWLDEFYVQPMKRNVVRIDGAVGSVSSRHCAHCAGKPGKCACASCPRLSGSRCSSSVSLHRLLGALTDEFDPLKRDSEVVRHCIHCKGLDAVCGCTDGCAKPAIAKCYEMRHCSHCKGLDAACGCTKDCPKPDSAKCHTRGHCAHCKGLDAACVCSFACPKPSGAKCTGVRHCRHCKGLDAACGCEEACEKPSGAKCFDASRSHCQHCKGLAAVCGCEHGCDKPPTAQCLIEHVGIMCDSCREQDISGVRYNCSVCPDYDLCARCYRKNKHEISHTFRQIDRVGCTPKLLSARSESGSSSQTPLARGAGGHSSEKAGFFYFDMTTSELKSFLDDNLVPYSEDLSLDDLRRCVWESHCDAMSGKDVMQFIAENDIDDSDCCDFASRRDCAKAAFRATRHPTRSRIALVVDQRVVLHGLKREEMNGCSGVIIDPETVPGRAMVKVDGVDKPFRVKFENIEICADDLD